MIRKAAWGSSLATVVWLTAAIATAMLLAGGAGAARTANEGVTLEQCANGTLSSPSPGCPPDWRHGDLNGSNSTYREGDSVPFRAVLTKLTPGDHTLVIQYDTTKSGKHAYDYLTRYDRTVVGADPCDSGTLCSGSGANSATIPLSNNPSVPSPFVSHANRYFTIWNGTIGAPALTTPSSDVAGEQQSITVPFHSEATSDTVVIAWGGHVADEINWGPNTAAGAISGSPYHMRVVSLDGDTTGHQDRSMKTDYAAPALHTDVKSASEPFPYVGTIPPGGSVTDNAALSGDNGPVTGTVSFFWCYAAAGTPDCSSPGSGTLLTEDVSVSDGTASSGVFSPAETGTYCFRSEYSPDASSNYSVINETNAKLESNGNHGECFIVAGESSLPGSSVATEVHDATGIVTSALVGSTVHDVASVSGSGEGVTPTGSVTFARFAGLNCSSEPSSIETVALVDGSASSPDATVPEGGLSYLVHYNGSEAYAGSTGICENLSSTVPPTTPPPPPAPTPPSTPPAAPAPASTPAPAPPAPSIDLAITKIVAPSPASLGGVVTWTLFVRNNGPDAATVVRVADALPAGLSLVSASASQGSCTSGAVINCQLGSLASGAVATVLVRTTATSTGSIVNTATVVGNEAETNTANNTASATLVVRGALQPPAQFCTAVAVSPKSILVGQAALLTMRVSQHGKAISGIKVRIKGSTLGIVTRASNAKGIVKVRVQPKRPGIVSFAPVAHKKCTSPRVGVVGVFTPPLTG